MNGTTLYDFEIAEDSQDQLGLSCVGLPEENESLSTFDCHSERHRNDESLNRFLLIISEKTFERHYRLEWSELLLIVISIRALL